MSSVFCHPLRELVSFLRGSDLRIILLAQRKQRERYERRELRDVLHIKLVELANENQREYCSCKSTKALAYLAMCQSREIFHLALPGPPSPAYIFVTLYVKTWPLNYVSDAGKSCTNLSTFCFAASVALHIGSGMGT